MYVNSTTTSCKDNRLRKRLAAYHPKPEKLYLEIFDFKIVSLPPAQKCRILLQYISVASRKLLGSVSFIMPSQCYWIKDRRNRAHSLFTLPATPIQTQSKKEKQARRKWTRSRYSGTKVGNFGLTKRFHRRRGRWGGAGARTSRWPRICFRTHCTGRIVRHGWGFSWCGPPQRQRQRRTPCHGLLQQRCYEKGEGKAGSCEGEGGAKAKRQRGKGIPVISKREVGACCLVVAFDLSTRFFTAAERPSKHCKDSI